MHVFEKPVFFEHVMGEGKPLGLAPDASAAYHPAALPIKRLRLKAPVKISVIHETYPPCTNGKSSA